MHSMCHYCCGELSKSEDELKQENKNPLKLKSCYSTESCRFCRGKQQRESLKHEDFNRLVVPSITPTTSLSSSDRSFSSEFSIDGNLYDRGNQEDCTNRNNQEDMDSATKSKPQDSNLEYPANAADSLGTVTEISNKREHDNILRDVEIKQIDYNQDAKESSIGDARRSSNRELESSNHDDDQMDAEIWKPPEPENPEDELDGGVADNGEDDDELDSGTKWGKSCSLSDFGDEQTKRYKLKEEKERALQEVINRKFKAIVSQLLKSVGVSSCTEDGGNWVNIVTALSWEAASLLKPAVIEGKPIDPNAYIKVKCVATGSPSQSQVIRGLVFKKHAAHKHMPTNYKNARLLLVQGALGQSSSGLASFKSIVQEKDYVKPVDDTI